MMRKALDIAIQRMNEAESALQRFASFIEFHGFCEFEPRVGFVNEESIIISFDNEDGSLGELSAEEAINIMESRGFITPDDF